MSVATLIGLSAIFARPFLDTPAAAAGQRGVKAVPPIAKSDPGKGDPGKPGKGDNPVRLHCGTRELSAAEIEVSEESVRQFLTKYRFNFRDSGSVIIPVWVHVITNSAGDGNIPDTQIYEQIKVMNVGYAGRDDYSKQTGQQPSAQSTANTPFRFVLVGIDRTQNDTWYTASINTSTGAETTASRAMKTTLRRGNSGTLNIYFNALSAGLLGYATFPSDYAADPGVDGVVILNTSVPRGAEVPYDFGDTATHEIGHWLGLFHTFQGGCATSSTAGGDLVADTPAESSSFFGMPTDNPTRDTCTTIAGRDPVENFMDYTDDLGMYQFTPNQSARMDTQHATFRPTP